MKRTNVVGLLVGGVVLTFAAMALAQDEAPLEVTEILMGTELENGVPTSPSTSFSRTDSSIYCVVRFRNRTGAEGHLRVGFEQAGDEPPAAGETGRRMPFPARSRYRTVVRGTPNRAPGPYRCVVRTDAGEVLSHLDFTITG